MSLHGVIVFDNNNYYPIIDVIHPINTFFSVIGQC